jgi:glutaredoxin
MPTRGSVKSLGVIVLLVVGGTQGLQWWRDAQAASDIKAHLGGQRITMYSTVECIYCAKAREWLGGHGIPWDECDVEHDAACLATFEAHGAPGTPLIRVGGQWRLGFDATWIAQALASNTARLTPDPAPAPTHPLAPASPAPHRPG